MNKKDKPLMAFFENILYLDDYINLYINEDKKIISSKPYKQAIKNGKIIDSQKFIASINLIKKDNKIKVNLFKEKMTIIINSSYSKEDKNLIKSIMGELNYTDIKVINELDLLKIKNNELYIFYEYTYYKLYYLNDLKKIKLLVYDKNEINNVLLEKILDMLKKDKIIIAGKDANTLINSINKKYNFFYYEDYSNLFIKLLLNMYNDV